ncbi:hypothetical protein [Chitinophaga arvensicola]|uniref:Uncharacterized protein n=1 Tax=Chitinophaga arvensicola TaxID=29529 RepID=A0A1I0SBG7_9BACT|nr:hypothetical protein [Chitinophaga arvensicola]SEW53996.1 hypothetical protein SAMN04488122_5832 [Chitinophaga arvensicola]
MKNIILIASILLIGSYSVCAQQGPSRAQVVKAGADKSLAAKDYSRIFLPNIGVSDAQKSQVNKLILELFDAKRALHAQDRKNPGVYAQQQPGLFNTFKTKLTGVLNAQQMSTFLASKPATDDKANMLSSIFY